MNDGAFFPPDNWSSVFFLIFRPLGIPNYGREKKIKLREWIGRGPWNTSEKYQGLSLKNGVSFGVLCGKYLQFA